MVEKDLLTVKEFSEAAQVSNKAIYQQIQGRLKDYTETIDNIIFIKREALEKFYGNKLQNSQVKSSQGSSQVESRLESKKDAEIVLLNRMLDTLNKELDDKQTTIDNQYKTIEALNKRIEEDGKRLDKYQTMILNQQNIMLTDRKDDIKDILAATSGETKEEVKEEAAAADVKEEPSTSTEKRTLKRRFLEYLYKQLQ